MTTLGDRARCQDCGAQLRRDHEGDQRCDPCQRRGLQLVLPEGFYDQPELEAALARFDFGTVLLALRTQLHWSQQTLAEFLGLEQGRISRIETGARALLELGVVVRVANRLTIPAGKLGFTHGVTVGGGTSTGRKDSWVQRRDFVERVAALTVGVTEVAGLDIERLLALLPQADPTGTRHVGAADVETIEQATAAFRDQDFTYGSAIARDTALTQLRATLPLLDARIAPEVRPRLLLATADLATQTGWMSHDSDQHDAARRLWMIALNLARAAEHPQGSDLTAYLLTDMALQAVHLGRLDEALRLVHLGHTATVSLHPISPSTASLLASIQARTLAVRGDAADCDRALGQAREHCAAIDPATAPPWTAYLAHTGISGHQGSTYYLLALHGPQPQIASRAVPLLRQAVEGFGPGYARLRAFYLPDLAGAHALTGDIDTALTIGHQAIDAVTALHSPQAYDRLRVLHTALQPLHTSPGVAELRERLHTTVA